MTLSALRLENHTQPRHDLTEAIAHRAGHALTLELETYPKPGLVSPEDSGSHGDMDVETFRASIDAVTPYFAALAKAGYSKSEMSTLRKIGLAAERDMLVATGGINTHRGAIFSLGLLCAAAGARAADQSLASLSLGEIVGSLWSRDILRGPVLMQSHGQMARMAHGAGGAQQEAADGFSHLYKSALPEISTMSSIGDHNAKNVQACFTLIANLEDTNLLHRGGLDGLRFAQSEARAFLERGGVHNPSWREDALAIHRRFIERRLSPGGSADLLACAIFVRDDSEALARNG